jgi:hypothetical protein
MSGSSDIATAIIYALVSIGLLTLCYYVGTSRYSVDYYLERRISWWWKVAEVRHPLSDVPPTHEYTVTEITFGEPELQLTNSR